MKPTLCQAYIHPPGLNTRKFDSKKDWTMLLRLVSDTYRAVGNHLRTFLTALAICPLILGTALASSFLSECCTLGQLRAPVTLADGVRVSWGDLGAPGGAPLLMMGSLEDFPYTKSYLSMWTDYMKARNVRLIFMETPGLFRESALQQPTISRLSDIAVDFMLALGYPSFSLYAHSHQGPQALDLASRYPQRLVKLLLSHARGEMSPNLIYNSTPPVLPPIEKYLYECVYIPNCIAPILEAELNTKWEDSLLPQEVAMLQRVPGMSAVLGTIWGSVAPMQVPYAAEYIKSLVRDPITLENVVTTTYFYDAIQDYYFPSPHIYSLNLQSRMRGQTNSLIFDGEFHIDSIIRHFDQVILDASGDGEEVIYCHNNVTIAAPRSTPPAGATLGNCFWTKPTYAVRGQSVSTWIGLKNSDAVGLLVDIRAEVSLGGRVVGIGELNSVPTGSSGFNNALMHTIALPPTTLTLSKDETLRLKISVRRTCHGGGHNSGTVRLWFNGTDANSRVSLHVNNEYVSSSYFIVSDGVLQQASGNQRMYIDMPLNSISPCPNRPFQSFGQWSVLVH